MFIGRFGLLLRCVKSAVWLVIGEAEFHHLLICVLKEIAAISANLITKGRFFDPRGDPTRRSERVLEKRDHDELHLVKDGFRGTEHLCLARHTVQESLALQEGPLDDPTTVLLAAFIDANGDSLGFCLGWLRARFIDAGVAGPDPLGPINSSHLGILFPFFLDNFSLTTCHLAQEELVFLGFIAAIVSVVLGRAALRNKSDSSRQYFVVQDAGLLECHEKSLRATHAAT